jgi:hypothetical protein
MATGGAQSAGKTTEEGPALAERRIVPAAPAGTSQSRLVPQDFVEDRTHDGRKFRMLNVIDEFTQLDAWRSGSTGS